MLNEARMIFPPGTYDLTGNKKMQMISGMRAFAITASAVVSCLFLAGIADASPSNKWRLEFSGSARSDGVIEVRITPVGAGPSTFSVSIPDRTRENSVAKLVVQALREQLPSDAFHVERDDGEDVLVKKRRGAANFDIEIVSNTVKNVRINVDRE